MHTYKYVVVCGGPKLTLTYQEVISELILPHSIIVGQFSYKMIIFWAKANHCLAPFSIVRAAKLQDEGRVNY